MRLRVRLRLRSLLILVALSAVVLAGLARASRVREAMEWRRRTMLYQTLARQHKLKAEEAFRRWRSARVNRIYGEQERYAWPSRSGRAAMDRKLIELDNLTASNGKSALYHAWLHDKYARAARRPWEPVEPDPPPP